MTEFKKNKDRFDRADNPLQKEKYYSTQRIRKGLVHFISGRSVAAVAAVIVPIILVRTLSVRDYAAYTAFSGLLIFIMTVTNLGIERVIPRYFTELKNANAERELYQFSQVLTIVRLVSLTIALVLTIIFYEPLSSWLNLPKSYEPVWGFTVYVFGFGISIHLARALQALMMQRDAAGGMVLEWLSKLGLFLTIVYVFKEISLTQALAIQGATAMMGCFYMFLRLRKHLKSGSISADENRILDYKQVVKFGRQNYFWNLSGMYTDPSTMKLISSAFFSASITATLGFVYSIIGVIQRYLPAVLLLNLIEPTVMARYCETKDFAQTSRLLTIVLRVNLFILAPATAWLYFQGGPLVLALTNGKYADSGWLITALMFVLMLRCHILIMEMAVNAIEKSEFLIWSNIWSLLLIFPAAVAVYFFELPGLVSSLIAVFIARNIYIVYRLRKEGYEYAIDWKRIIRIYIIACLAGGSAEIILYYLPFSWINIIPFVSAKLTEFIISAFITGLFFLLIAYVWKPFTESERITLNKFFGRRCFVW